MSRIKGVQGFKGFISFEGVEGCGKTTQVKLTFEYLKRKNYPVIATEEPGGTKVGRLIRETLLAPENHMEPLTELLLYSASRAQHVHEVIYPALMQNTIVITDRFIDSTVAYQGFARGVDISVINTINEIVSPDLKPYITFLLDVDAEEGLRRNRGVQKIDRLEMEDIAFHREVRKAYLQIAEKEPERVKVIDASQSIEKVHKDIVQILDSIWL
jgi:dTMP kinase